jgi:hypothetical protein
MSDDTEQAATTSKKLTDEEKARIEKSRLKAVSLREAKIISHPYLKQK